MSCYERYIFHSICLVRGVCTQAPCYCIVMEYCPYGQLYEILRDGKRLPPSLMYGWAKQIACGMTYLHSHKIIHRDLKSPKWAVNLCQNMLNTRWFGCLSHLLMLVKNVHESYLLQNMLFFFSTACWSLRTTLSASLTSERAANGTRRVRRCHSLEP